MKRNHQRKMRNEVFWDRFAARIHKCLGRWLLSNSSPFSPVSKLLSFDGKVYGIISSVPSFILDLHILFVVKRRPYKSFIVRVGDIQLLRNNTFLFTFYFSLPHSTHFVLFNESHMFVQIRFNYKLYLKLKVWALCLFEVRLTFYSIFSPTNSFIVMIKKHQNQFHVLLNSFQFLKLR